MQVGGLQTATKPQALNPTNTALFSSKQLTSPTTKKMDRKPALAARTRETRHASVRPKDSALCPRCRQIDFWAIFNLTSPPPPKNGRVVFVLGQLDPSSSCPACLLFAAVALRRSWRNLSEERYHLRLFRTSLVLGTHEVAKKSKLKPSVALGVLPGNGRKAGIYPGKGLKCIAKASSLPGRVMFAAKYRSTL